MVIKPVLILLSLALAVKAVEVARYAPASLQPGDEFGYFASAYGSFLAVGAPGTQEDQGTTYIYNCTSAANCTQTITLTPSDGDYNDTFGEAVGVYKDLLVVGAPGKDESQGGVYIYNCTSAQNCSLKSVIQRDDGEPGDGFGEYLVVDNYWVVIGAPGWNNFTGSAYLYNCSNPANCTWAYTFAPNDLVPGDFFGYSVGISGWEVVIGASSLVNPGKAYAYDCTNPKACKLITTFTPPSSNNTLNSTPLAAFGTLLWVGSNNITYIAAYGWNNNTGAVFVYNCSSGTNCTWVSTIIPQDALMGDQFGAWVQADEYIVVIGSQYRNDGAGAAYVYNCSDATNCKELTYLNASDATPDDEFGWAVAISNTTIFITAPFKNSSRGEMYTFNNPLSNGTNLGRTSGAAQLSQEPNTIFEASRIAPSNLQEDSYFGYTLAAWGNMLVSSAIGTNSSRGSAFVYNCTSPVNCTLVQTLNNTNAPGSAANDTFGTSLALINTTIILVGAPGFNSSRGAVYIYNCTTNSSSSSSSNSTTSPPTMNPNTTVSGYSNITNCSWVSTLTLPDGKPEDYFGMNIVNSQSNPYIIAIAAYGRNNYTGAVYLYNCTNATNCTLESNVTAQDGVQGDWFSAGLGLDDWLLVVGSPEANNGHGSAYAYNCSNVTNCTMITKFAPQFNVSHNSQTNYTRFNFTLTPTVPSLFGSFVSVSNNITFIGALGLYNETGSIFIYNCSSGTNCSWSSTLTPQNVSLGEEFGSYILAYEDYLVVGSQLRNDSEGAVYVFNCSDVTNCSQIAYLQPSDGAADDEFGWSLAITNTTIFVGSIYKNNSRGEVYSYWLNATSQNSSSTVTPTSAPTSVPPPVPPPGTPAPTPTPSHAPSTAPTPAPSTAPTPTPSHAPSTAPTPAPTTAPTPAPTTAPTPAPTTAPTPAPTTAPTPAPTTAPTPAPTTAPTPAPTHAPTPAPTTAPTPAPTRAPTPAPTTAPTTTTIDYSLSGTDAARSATIKQGDTVTWNFTDDLSHSVTSDATPPLFDSGILSAHSTYSHTFTTAGTFPYHCNVHASMHGTITVTAS